MNNIANHLRSLGENVDVKHQQIHVKFSILIQKLVIKRDIAENKLVYSYNQLGDLIAILILFTSAGVFMTKDNFTMAMFNIGVALMVAVICIIKEIRVNAIKREVNQFLKFSPKLQTISALSINSEADSHHSTNSSN